MGKIRVSFEVDCTDLDSYPTKKADDFKFLVSNVGDILYDLYLHKMEMQLKMMVRNNDKATQAALDYHYAVDQHFALQILDNLRIEATMDDGTTHTYVQPESMKRKDYPEIKKYWEN